MFTPKTERIKFLAKKYPNRITELNSIFDKPTNVYIDFANVIYWQEKMAWHIDLKRLKQLLDSFDTIHESKFYNGTLEQDPKNKNIIDDAINNRYTVITKPVKRMNFPIDASSIPDDSPAILNQFIRKPLLQKLNIETIKFLNNQLKMLNQQGIYYLQDLKCNFDVEIGRDMLIDWAKDDVDNFVLWSGDSDFLDPVMQLLSSGKKVILFVTVRQVSAELNNLRKDGLLIFDIKKIRNLICWKREIKL